MNDIYRQRQRNVHNYKQAMKTGKHEDKPQVSGQLLTIGNFLRRYYKKISLMILFLKSQLTVLTNVVVHVSKLMCLPKT